MALDTLLVTLGPSDERRIDAIVDAVAAIVGDREAEVILLHVFDRESYEAIQDELNIDPDSETTPDDVAERKDLVEDVREALDARGIASSVRGALGAADESILRVSEEVGADHVVVGGGERSPAGKAVFGSTAQYVLLNADAPVTFVRGDGSN
jgi:nucleotide-binding universal stress UspA family protein